MAPHVGVTSARARALHALAHGTARVVVASAAALLPRVSAPERLLAASLELRPGQDIAPTDLAELLVDAGFTREDPADEHGEFAVRGGIVDVFPAGETQPVRLEFIGDTIEIAAHLRPGDAAVDRADRSGRHRAAARRAAATTAGADACFDYLARARDSRIVVSEARRSRGERDASSSSRSSTATRRRSAGRSGRAAAAGAVRGRGAASRRGSAQATQLAQLGLDDDRRPANARVPTRIPSRASAAERSRASRPMPAGGRDARAASPTGSPRSGGCATKGETTLFVAATPGRAERTIELLKEYDVFAVPVERAEDARYAAVLVAVGGLSRGFRLPDAGLQIYAEADVFEEERRAPERRRSATKAFLSDLRDLKVGDLVVHVDHGIGMFVGLKQIGVGDSMQEFLELRYAGDDKLFVPVERLDLVQKYTGATRPPVDRLGGTSWERAKTRVKKAMRDMAEELLKLYAARKAVPGHAFSPDSHWQQEFEDAFEYELTPDQKTAIADIKRDMESPTPMDRLLCGDVGYGKTEVAMRAAFKAVMDGKQVAVPGADDGAGVSAPEDAQGALRRLSGAHRHGQPLPQQGGAEGGARPISPPARSTSSSARTGCCRRTSQFRDLGLLVVDEEQRFGVAHKEKIKQLRKKVDVLTMSATPIPRTLNMSLVGIRDMSIIETPPKDRLSIQTNVVKFDQQVIGRAIRSELDARRPGLLRPQPRRVDLLDRQPRCSGWCRRRASSSATARWARTRSSARCSTSSRGSSTSCWRRRSSRTASTSRTRTRSSSTAPIATACRSSISCAAASADRIGPAYAYLLIPPEDNLSPVAKKRLAAIKEFSDLGSGFRVAALDLEIRGAGNLLGGEQSGHIEAVGFEMYMKLLEQTVRELKGEELEDDVRATVNLRVDLRIDESYVPDMNQRLMLYRKVAAARREEEIDRVLEEAADRYGPLPDSVLNLADYGRIRVMADRLGIESIDREGRTVVLKFRPQAKVDPVRLVALVRQRPDLTLVPPAALKLKLDGADGSGLDGSGAEAIVDQPQALSHQPGQGRQASRPRRPAGGRRGRGQAR